MLHIYVHSIQNPALGVNDSSFHYIETNINDNKETPTTGHQAPCQLCDTPNEAPLSPVINGIKIKTVNIACSFFFSLIKSMQ